MTLDLDPGLGALGNPRLVRAIIDEMDGGAIPFERFMWLALYHAEFGYYRKPGRIGKQGDFLTSPLIHPMFGWAAAGWCRQARSALTIGKFGRSLLPMKRQACRLAALVPLVWVVAGLAQAA